ncbi:MAG: phospholipase effector Tle1 domain-containing protein, partial [Mycobacteriaceae bacterium]
MTRRLIVCCDGTWNTPDQKIGAIARPTNVTKLALCIAGT